MELRVLFSPLKKKFDTLFGKTFNKNSNSEFITKINGIYLSGNWMALLKAFKSTLERVEKMITNGMYKKRKKLTNRSAVEQDSPSPNKKARKGDKKSGARSLKPSLIHEWKAFGASVQKFEVQQEQVKNSFAFSFVEGALVKAIKKVTLLNFRN